MNQELTRRIIGAIVVTALAAIFIPMLFEDPADNSAQVVSELSLPEEPAFAVEDTSSKLPRNAQIIEALPDETEETPDKSGLAANSAETLPPPEGEDTVSDSMDPEAPGDEGGNPDFTPDTLAEPTAPPTKPLPNKSQTTRNPPLAAEYRAETPTASNKKSPPLASALNKPEPAPPKPVKPKTNDDLSRFFIQAGSFGKKENALALADTLRKQGMPVVLETMQTGKGVMYRLKVGPELDKKRAAALKSKLDQQNIKGILVAE